MPVNFVSLLPVIVFWLLTSLFFVVMVRRNNQITQSAKTFWSIIVVVFWFQGALVYASWGIMAQVWNTLFDPYQRQPNL
ncbi:MAG: hypothetical protein SH821_13525 [Phototrophicales bacterium]|nr:hypothetical protein [Phototrophicales bacterium]